MVQKILNISERDVDFGNENFEILLNEILFYVNGVFIEYKQKIKDHP